MGCIEEKAVITTPLYSECIEKVEEYEEVRNKEFETIYKSDSKLDIELEYFNHVRKSYPSMVGYIKISGKSLALGLDLYANAIMGLCYPEVSSTVKNSQLGMCLILKKIEETKDKGIFNKYISINKDEITLFYNSEIEKR